MRRVQWKNPRLITLASMTLVIGAALALWGVLSLRRSSSPFIIHNSSFSIISTSSFSQPKKYPCPLPGDFKEVDIPVGLLCDYYEHGMEHAPPRDPSGVMQKRERFYAAPHDPFELLTSVATAIPTDKSFIAALSSFRSELDSDRPADEKELESLEGAASRSLIKSDALIDAGRAINWLAGDKVAAAFFRAGLADATVEYSHVLAGDPAAVPLLRAMDQTKALWRLKAWSALEQRFALANALNVPLSPQQRRAHYLLADVLHGDGRSGEAADAIISTMREHQRAGDLGALEASDVPEMQWTLGVLMMADRRSEAAISVLDSCAQQNGPHQSDAQTALILALIRTDQLDLALERLERLRERVGHGAIVNSITAELQARLQRRARERILRAAAETIPTVGG